MLSHNNQSAFAKAHGWSVDGLKKFLNWRPIRNIPRAANIHNQDASPLLTICADYRDMWIRAALCSCKDVLNEVNHDNVLCALLIFFQNHIENIQFIFFKLP